MIIKKNKLSENDNIINYSILNNSLTLTLPDS